MIAIGVNRSLSLSLSTTRGISSVNELNTVVQNLNLYFQSRSLCAKTGLVVDDSGNPVSIDSANPQATDIRLHNPVQSGLGELYLEEGVTIGPGFELDSLRITSMVNTGNLSAGNPVYLSTLRLGVNAKKKTSSAGRYNREVLLNLVLNGTGSGSRDILECFVSDGGSGVAGQDVEVYVGQLNFQSDGLTGANFITIPNDPTGPTNYTRPAIPIIDVEEAKRAVIEYHGVLNWDGKPAVPCDGDGNTTTDAMVEIGAGTGFDYSYDGGATWTFYPLGSFHASNAGTAFNMTLTIGVPANSQFVIRARMQFNGPILGFAYRPGDASFPVIWGPLNCAGSVGTWVINGAIKTTLYPW